MVHQGLMGEMRTLVKVSSWIMSSVLGNFWPSLPELGLHHCLALLTEFYGVLSEDCVVRSARPPGRRPNDILEVGNRDAEASLLSGAGC
jgi:hypothetical protein